MKTAREIIETYDGPHVRIMEVCGTHTHEIFRLGIRKLLPAMPSFSITFSGGTISTISGFSSKIVRILPHAAAA